MGTLLSGSAMKDWALSLLHCVCHPPPSTMWEMRHSLFMMSRWLILCYCLLQRKTEGKKEKHMFWVDLLALNYPYCCLWCIFGYWCKFMVLLPIITFTWHQPPSLKHKHLIWSSQQIQDSLQGCCMAFTDTVMCSCYFANPFMQCVALTVFTVKLPWERPCLKLSSPECTSSTRAYHRSFSGHCCPLVETACSCREEFMPKAKGVASLNDEYCANI